MIPGLRLRPGGLSESQPPSESGGFRFKFKYSALPAACQTDSELEL
jgi:hypothetical protein